MNTRTTTRALRSNTAKFEVFADGATAVAAAAVPANVGPAAAANAVKKTLAVKKVSVSTKALAAKNSATAPGVQGGKVNKPSQVTKAKAHTAAAAAVVLAKKTKKDIEEVVEVKETSSVSPQAAAAAEVTVTKPKPTTRTRKASADRTEKKTSAPPAASAGADENAPEANDVNSKEVAKVSKLESKQQSQAKSATVATEDAVVRTRDIEHDDLDAEDVLDPLMATEYAEDIIGYTRFLELKVMPCPNYMDTQAELSWKMRGILIDWLIEVHHKFRLLPETLYLTVNIIDRFLSKRVVALLKLQLVGLAAMVIATKYEEIAPPGLQQFNYMADNGYSEDEIIRAERYILNVLDFELHYPSPMNFLRRASKADNYDIQNRTLAKYLMEVTIVDHRFLKYTPSRISAAALYLARIMLDKGEWHNNLVFYSGYTEEQLLPVAEIILDYFDEARREGGVKHEALYKKYASKKFLKASIYVKDWIARRHEEKKQTLHKSEAENE